MHYEGLHHQLTHGEMLIQFGAEDDVANLRNIYYSQLHYGSCSLAQRG